jgi:hypothetical protein
MNLKEKFIEKRDAAIEWANEHKAEIISGTVLVITSGFVVKRILDSNKVKTFETITENANNEQAVIEEHDEERYSDDLWQFKERDEDKVKDFCEENKISYNTSYGREDYTYGGKDFDVNGELTRER